MNVMTRLAVAQQPDRTAARGERHSLRIQAHGLVNGRRPVDVVIHDISAAGMLLESGEALHAGDELDVELLHSKSPRALIVWSSGPFYGCSFAEPLADALLRSVLLRDAAWSSGEPRAPAGDEDSAAGLAVRIVKIRQVHGLTAEEFASRIGVSRQAVWYWETGQRSPRPEQLRRMRDEFGLDLAGTSGSLPAAAPGGVEECIAQCRHAIAGALSVDPARVRISVDW